MERRGDEHLKKDVDVLMKAHDSAITAHFPNLIARGRAREFNYMVLTLLGSSLKVYCSFHIYSTEGYCRIFHVITT